MHDPVTFSLDAVRWLTIGNFSWRGGCRCAILRWPDGRPRVGAVLAELILKERLSSPAPDRRARQRTRRALTCSRDARANRVSLKGA